jgi:hypothetical protein
LSKILLFCLIALNAHSIEPFQEQIPLGMTAPNTAKDKSIKWIPLTSNPQNNFDKSSKTSNKNIDESIKNQIQKKMQALLKPLKDDEDER